MSGEKSGKLPGKLPAHLEQYKWKPGTAPNPKGRPAFAREIRELAQANSAQAIKRLVELMDSDDDRVAAIAANSILDRAIGKPMQAHEISGPDGSPLGSSRLDLSKLSHDELQMMQRLALKAATIDDKPLDNVIDVVDSSPTHNSSDDDSNV